MSEERKQVRPRLPEFAAWVAEELSGIVENDPTAVTRWMVVQWVKDNEEWLAGKRITYDRFYEETRASGPKGTVSTMKPRIGEEAGEEPGEQTSGNGTNGG